MPVSAPLNLQAWIEENRALLQPPVGNVCLHNSQFLVMVVGGPNARSMREDHTEGAFLFPQMMPGIGEDTAWTPHFIDYMFLAFNTSTALSPTDSPVLSRWAKVLMMAESPIVASAQTIAPAAMTTFRPIRTLALNAD